jgi:hypothetical protein
MLREWAGKEAEERGDVNQNKFVHSKRQNNA